MSASDSTYTVGPGRPPLHTRFQKGRSGNPSGKPGPAKLARRRFQQALCAALDGETAELKDARPRVTFEALVRRLTLDALGGNQGAMKIILAELDRESAHEGPAPAPGAPEGQATAGGSMTDEAVRGSGEWNAAEPPPMPDYALWRKAHPDD